MKRWQDDAIVLTLHQHREYAGIAYVLSQHHGLYGGYIHGWRSKKQRGRWQSGSQLNLRWYARHENQLGTLTLVKGSSIDISLYHAPMALAALLSAMTITQKTMPQRQPEPKMFFSLKRLLHRLQENPTNATTIYACWEYDFLTIMGFGLHLTTCASGKTCLPQDLVYISPKTGHAVAHSIGRNWHDKLFPLPPFLRFYAHSHEPPSSPTHQHIDQALTISGYFIQKHLYKKTPLPTQRSMLTMHHHKKDTSYKTKL